MYHWLLAVVISIFQEVVTFNALLFETHKGEYALWAITVIFLLATAFDIWIGYRIGIWAKKKYTKGRIIEFTKKITDRFHAYVGKRGRKVALIFLGNLSFPYVNAFIAAWLEIPFWESFIFLFIGNLISYAFSWIFVLGVATVVPSSTGGFAAVIVISILLVMLVPRMRR